MFKIVLKKAVKKWLFRDDVDGWQCKWYGLFFGNLWVFGIGDRGGKRYSTSPFIRINWDAEPSGYAENPNNLISFFK